MNNRPRQPIDCNGVAVLVGSRVRVLSLSGDWYQRLPADERVLVDSMIGEVFEVEEIDQYGQPWVCKRWPDDEAGTCKSHSIALEPTEMVAVDSSKDEVPDAGQTAMDLAEAQRAFEEMAAKLGGGNDGPRRA